MCTRGEARRQGGEGGSERPLPQNLQIRELRWRHELLLPNLKLGPTPGQSDRHEIIAVQAVAQGPAEKKEIESHEWSCQAMAPRFTMPTCRVGPVLAAGNVGKWEEPVDSREEVSSKNNPSIGCSIDRYDLTQAAMLMSTSSLFFSVYVPRC